MKKFILPLLLFSALIGQAQNNPDYILAFDKSIPGNLGTPFHLPPLERKAVFDIDDIAPYDAKQRILVVASDELYHKLFSGYEYTTDSLANHPDKKDFSYQWMVKHLRDSIPDIDFTKKELILYSACAQCLATCHHKESDACHRNVCVFTNVWFIRDKTTAEEKRAQIPL